MKATLVKISLPFGNNFDISLFSKQKNFLLVGTADGNLAIFEDKSVKVNVECILHKNLCSLFYVCSTPAPSKWL